MPVPRDGSITTSTSVLTHADGVGLLRPGAVETMVVRTSTGPKLGCPATTVWDAAPPSANAPPPLAVSTPMDQLPIQALSIQINTKQVGFSYSILGN